MNTLVACSFHLQHAKYYRKLCLFDSYLTNYNNIYIMLAVGTGKLGILVVTLYDLVSHFLVIYLYLCDSPSVLFSQKFFILFVQICPNYVDITKVVLLVHRSICCLLHTQSPTLHSLTLCPLLEQHFWHQSCCQMGMDQLVNHSNSLARHFRKDKTITGLTTNAQAICLCVIVV